MTTHTISTKQLRTDLPAIRAGLARGNHYSIIYRSKVIGTLSPATDTLPTKITLPGGTLRLTELAGRPLTPEYLNELAESMYD